MHKLLLLLIIPFLSFGQIVATEDCSSIPDPGPCFGYAITYFFNQATSQCEESFWGLCDGVVPFWTLEDCQNSCENNSLIDDLLTKKILLQIIDLFGRQTTNKGFNIKIYDDGSVEKKYVIE